MHGDGLGTTNRLARPPYTRASADAGRTNERPGVTARDSPAPAGGPSSSGGALGCAHRPDVGRRHVPAEGVGRRRPRPVRRRAGSTSGPSSRGAARRRPGLRPGDTLLGIGRRMLNPPAEAASELGRHADGETVRYLVQRGEQVLELKVVLSPYRLGSAAYVYYALLGALFFGLGLFVFSPAARATPRRRSSSSCASSSCSSSSAGSGRSSYYWIDYFVQVAGTLALFLLGAVFLHFFLLFPSPEGLPLRRRAAPGEAPALALVLVQRFLNGSPLALRPSLHAPAGRSTSSRWRTLRRTGDRAARLRRAAGRTGFSSPTTSSSAFSRSPTPGGRRGQDDAPADPRPPPRHARRGSSRSSSSRSTSRPSSATSGTSRGASSRWPSSRSRSPTRS